MERVVSQHHGPGVTLCHFRVCMAAGVNQNGPAFASDSVNVFARLYKVMQESASCHLLQKNNKLNINGFYRTLIRSISPS